LVFEFAENEYLKTLLLEKSYTITKEYLLEKIESTNIQWQEGKNISAKKVSKKMKNKSKIFILNNLFYLFYIFYYEKHIRYRRN
jgi:hypothetical protein